MPEMRGLYAITPEQPDTGRLLLDCAAVLAGGCRWLQYRDKISPPEERLRRAFALAALCEDYDAALIVNDDIDLALAVDAAGAHLGRDDGNLASARTLLGPDFILGASCYGDFALARAAQETGTSYVAFGAAFPSPTKPAAVVADHGLFARAAVELAVPAIAIGGITLDNAPALVAVGARWLAVITDLFSAPDITARAAAYQRLFEEAAP